MYSTARKISERLKSEDTDKDVHSLNSHSVFIIMDITVIATIDFKIVLIFYLNKEILLGCKDEILAFTNFTFLAVIFTMIALLFILFITKLYARNDTFRKYLASFHLQALKY